jgi:fumarate hydratase class I
MPVTVAVNSEGISVHQTGPKEWQAKIQTRLQSGLAGVPILA